MVTQAELKELLTYDPDTGIFIWRNPRRGVYKKEAGSISLHGYVEVGLVRGRYVAHRLAWLYVYGVWPKQLDHINHNRLDNRIINLRDVPHIDNCRNQKKHKNNTSGFTGVSFHSGSGKWRAHIKIMFKQIHLGLFDDKFEAVCARMSANNKYNFHENHGK